LTAELKRQRDTFLAYALAAADILFQLDDSWKVLSVTGAAVSVLGAESAKILGSDFLKWVWPADRSMATNLLINALRSGRIQPATVRLEGVGKRAVLTTLGACSIPSVKGSVQVTLSVANPGSAYGASLTQSLGDAETGLLTREELAEVLSSTPPSMAKENRLQILRIDGLDAAQKRLDKEQNSQLLKDIGGALRSSAQSGIAGQLSETTFGLLQGEEFTPRAQAAIASALAELAQGAGLQANALAPATTSISLSGGLLSGPDIARALAYVTHGFSKGETSLPESLEKGLQAAMDETAHKLNGVRDIIRAGDFDLHFQPIVALATGQAHHFEALLRLKDGRNPFEVVTFSENIGLMQAFDLAVCQKAIAAVVEHPTAEIAINLSGYSVQDAQFAGQLTALLKPVLTHKSRILFELTESGLVEDVGTAANLLNSLRRQGFAVCLDDFGSGAASYHYLRHFEFDYLKLDGAFFKAALTSERQKKMVSSITTLCKDLGISVIAEMIETKDDATFAKSLSIAYGQGYLFGKALPDLPAPSIATAVSNISARRKGAVEGWG